jgi:hypothetical protein
MSTTSNLIVVSAMAHNIATRRNEPLIMDDPTSLSEEETSSDDEEREVTVGDDVSQASRNIIRSRGQAHRDRLVQNYF